MALITLLAATVASTAAWQRAASGLETALADRLSITQHVLSSEIGRLRLLPRVMAEDPRLQAALDAPQDATRVAAANAYLARLRAATEAEEAYLIGADGVTIAASNWENADSFIGAHYGFRPYFKDAMTVGEGQYFAIGVTTGRPGVFLSARIGAGDGVAVVKISLAALEQAWTRAGEVAAVSDGDGVVFLSSLPHWRYRSLKPLSPEVAAQIAVERRYASLGAGPPLARDADEISEPGQGRLRLMEGPVAGTQWRLLVGLPVAGLRNQAILIALIVSTAGFCLSAVAYTIWQRRQILRLRLEEADRLELRVEERTRALAQEIEERRRAEAELRLAQETLVQATKLAVLGRMSAAIVHEVGQSLSALDNNLAVSELHGRAGAVERLEGAVARSRRMVRRLQGVVTRLRTFGTRQVPVERQPVDLTSVIAVAAEIVAPRATELSVRLDLPEGGLAEVMADAPRLEQVLSNLLLNAIEAAARGAAKTATVTAAPGERHLQANVTRRDKPEGAPAGPSECASQSRSLACSNPAVRMGASDTPALPLAGNHEPKVSLAVSGGDRVTIAIRDNGPGIPPERRLSVLEPFVSDRAEGMGLGLYIVQNFLEEMGGRLELTDAEGGGTLALIHLPPGKAS